MMARRVMAGARAAPVSSGMALEFSGSANVEIPLTSVIIESAYTLACWLKTAGSDSNYPQIMTTDNSVYADRVFQLRMIKSSGVLNFLRWSASNSLVANLNSTVAVNDDTWHHVAAVFDSSAGSKLYVDGIERGADPITTTNKNLGGYEPLLIGARLSHAKTDFWDGLIDDARLYSSALSASDVMELASNRDGEVVLTGLEGRWMFNEGVADTAASGTGSVLDTSGNARHATPYDSPYYREAA